MPSSPLPLGSYVGSWAPGPVTAVDDLPAGPVAALSAVLDLPGAAAESGAALPPLWQWLYFLAWPPHQALGVDGHPAHGHFMPPLPDRQRMWAGGRCEFVHPLRLGDAAERVSSLKSATVKEGRTGEMLLVTEQHEFRQHGRLCVVEEQDIVYRSGRAAGQHPAGPDATTIPSPADPWQLPLQPDPALLFRFSALTANAHRIHYDSPYAQHEEGYPAPVVHGPLLALLMLELPRRHVPGSRVRALSYRLRRPVFAGEHLAVCGTPADSRADLRVATGREQRHATAKVTYA
ncbi:MaoC family dehydratase N-terminal domain-containing protein [Streptomyces sp. NPDC101776]|uniref:FAS1-like dehydratase domain-containing protein n=1 Tax=Streptomyces sp. NPDC101776 TaxID=3366146 RepID=UPI0037FBD3FF